MKQLYRAGRLTILLYVALLFVSGNVLAQSPFMVPPRWMFGYQAGMNFPGFTGAPVVLTGNPSTSAIAPALEASSSVCAPSGALTFYSNAVRIYNGTNGLVRDMNATNSLASNSATNGCVIVPDPSSPTNQAYIFLANDLTVGLQPNKGIWYYRLGAGGVLSGPTQLCTGSQVDESLCAGSDGVGGYWILSHGMDNTFWRWHVTTTGVSAVTTFTHSPYVGGTGVGSMKISKCQNKIAYTGNNSLLVYDWNMLTGTLTTGTALFSSVLGMGATFSVPVYGLEFSPDGSKVYHTLLGEIGASTGGTLRQLNLATSAFTTLSTSSANGGFEIGTMQLGPDDKIYVSQVPPVGGTTNAVYVGVINSPNVAGAGASYSSTGFTLKPANASTDPSNFRGIANEAWTGPNTPTIAVADGSTCLEKILTLSFTNYFNQNIAIDATTLQWSFDGGSTWTAAGSSNPFTHNYGSNATFSTRARFRDQTCNTQWTAIQPVTLSCPAPVEWLGFEAVSNGTTVQLHWATSMEKDNQYFEIMRSADGNNFSSIGTIEGAGNSTIKLDYHYIDKQPLTGINYYKIVQHDLDGKETSSAIRQAGNLYEAKILVAPNPSAGEFNLIINHSHGARIILTDALGKIVYEGTLATGENQHHFGADLAKGSYVLKVISGEEVLVEKLVKE